MILRLYLLAALLVASLFAHAADILCTFTHQDRILVDGANFTGDATFHLLIYEGSAPLPVDDATTVDYRSRIDYTVVRAD